jgi:hypothetical protein
MWGRPPSAVRRAKPGAFLDNFDLVAFGIANLEVLNTLAVARDASDINAPRHHDIAHFADPLSEQDGPKIMDGDFDGGDE